MDNNNDNKEILQSYKLKLANFEAIAEKWNEKLKSYRQEVSKFV